MQTRQHQQVKQTKSLTGVNEHTCKKQIQFAVIGEKWPFESNLKICQYCDLTHQILCTYVAE